VRALANSRQWIFFAVIQPDSARGDVERSRVAQEGIEALFTAAQDVLDRPPDGQHGAV
jgi:hypothetical protein